MLRVGDHDQRPEYVLAPKGYHPAVCTEIEDLGIQETSYKGEKKKQHKVKFVWVIEGQFRDDGEPLSISQRYTLSAYENAKLLKHICGWVGSMTEEQFKLFDLETLQGKRCQLFIEHNTKDGKTFANVVSIGEAPLINFATLSQKIAACWTHPGLDALKGEAYSARKQGSISPDELKQLAAASQARRTEIDTAAAGDDTPSF